MLNYSIPMVAMESGKFELYVTHICQKTNSRPKPYREGYKLLCPSHDDTRSSFVMSQKADGTILMKCFAGCDINDICRAIDIEVKDLFPAKQRGHSW